MIPIDMIENTETCFIQLWLLLNDTRLELKERYKRNCIRNIMRHWFGPKATDDLIWEVCIRCDQLGLNELPPLKTEPRPYRELLEAIVGVVLNKSHNQINLAALDHAYRIAYPHGVTLNLNKK